MDSAAASRTVLVGPGPAATAQPPGDGKLLLGLVGAGIERSLTPALQEEEARSHGLRLHYQLIDLDRTPGSLAQLPALLSAARIMGFGGLNITYPCKQAVIPLLDALSDDARAIGAVNTVVIREGRLVGHNTDASGWAWGFRRALPQADLSCVVLLGAGGAGSAIAHALLQCGTERLRIIDRETARAHDLAHALQARYGRPVEAVSDAAHALHTATGLVHATPTGMDKLPGMPLDAALLRRALWVSEIVYFPLDTELLRAARSAGCAVVDGGTMAVGQAVGAFELFTGLQADAARMERHFRALVAGR
ncbi:shikimate dehydrogenase [Ramlibacter sp. AN1015]|uniref:shikimate dehydrogenase n=1 Tax=Ramlibacter sp. AN1015 TaxID=3133428 RepID=UPI0030BC65D8